MTIEERAKKLEKAKNISIPCPSCNVNINLAAPWACENCKHEHNTEEDPELTIPVSDCADGCSQPIQTAFQCINCSRHIVLNEDLYISSSSYLEPYNFVARYSEDDTAPIPNSRSEGFLDSEGSPFED